MSGSPSKGKEADRAPSSPAKSTVLGTMALPLTTLSSLLTMQDVEDNKPRLSKISWLADVLVYRTSIIPAVTGPVLFMTIFSCAVAMARLWLDREVGLTNNVVPLLSVVVGLLLVFRNSSAYERYAEGRKDFTTLMSNARNLSRLIWINTVVPPNTSVSDESRLRARLTAEKRNLIRLVVAYVVATKHHLRAEGGMHHEDLQGLLPLELLRFDKSLKHAPEFTASPHPLSPVASPQPDEEAAFGVPPLMRSSSTQSHLPRWTHGDSSIGRRRPQPMKRPTGVRIVVSDHEQSLLAIDPHRISTERTPLIKPGVKPDIRKTIDDVERRAERGLGRMVELGLPLIIRTLFKFRRKGYLESVGPAALVQSMTDQLGAMERVQTPLPYVFCVHLKQCVTLYLLCLPFVLVDTMGWRMVWVVTCTAFTLCGVEGIASQCEQPFGTDPCDLNLDLYCTELLCEVEAILERLPEGGDDDDEDEDEAYQRPLVQIAADDIDGDCDDA